MKVLVSSLLVTSLVSFVIGGQSNEEHFGYGIKLKTNGRLLQSTIEIDSNREEQQIEALVAKADPFLESLTFVDVNSSTIVIKSTRMGECAIFKMSSDDTFETVLQVLKTPPRYRLGIYGVQCILAKKRVNVEKYEPRIQELCSEGDSSYKIKSCRPAESNNSEMDICLASGYVYDTTKSGRQGGLFCIRRFDD